jgi:hypothetical protein
MNKNVRAILLPLFAVPLIWLLLRDREPVEDAGDSTASDRHHVSAPPAAAPVSGAAGVSPSAAGTVPATGHPLPKTMAELNAFSDGPLPLPDKIQTLTVLMRTGTAEQARAAAIRAIFIVRNADFTTHLQPLVVQGGLKPEAMEVLALNLYDRPLDVLLPAWAQIVEQPNHPMASAATDGLEFHLKEKASARGPALALAIKECLGGGRN